MRGRGVSPARRAADSKAGRAGVGACQVRLANRSSCLHAPCSLMCMQAWVVFAWSVRIRSVAGCGSGRARGRGLPSVGPRAALRRPLQPRPARPPRRFPAGRCAEGVRRRAARARGTRRRPRRPTGCHPAQERSARTSGRACGSPRRRRAPPPRRLQSRRRRAPLPTCTSSNPPSNRRRRCAGTSRGSGRRAAARARAPWRRPAARRPRLCVSRRARWERTMSGARGR
mmetsp:Transcript_8828/g.27742  ORF Transcript_8828/g.27742 Transcript_8828/m.27742 type:complete len:228 (-) Transcript_8828:131-814(-)